MRAIAIYAAIIAAASPVGLRADPPSNTTGSAQGTVMPPPPAHYIVAPKWLKTPNGYDFALSYPALAASRGVGGRAVITCEIGDTGRLQSCQVSQESPPGFGFGAAALKLSALFLMSPMSLDGHPVGGGHITIPIRFMPASQASTPWYMRGP